MHPFLFISTLKDMLRPMRIFVWVLLGVVLALVALLWSKMSREAFGVEQYGLLATTIVYRIVALAAAMFTMSVVAQDIEQKTIVYTLTRPIPRPTTLVSRALAAIAAVTLMSWVSLTFIALVILGPGFMTHSEYWMDMLIMLLGASAYSALFIFVTLIMNRPMVAILFFAFIWEGVVPNIPGDMYYLSINTYMTAMATHAGQESSGGIVAALMGDATTIPSWVAMVVLLGVFAAFMVINCFWFKQFAFLPREDAE